MLCFRVPQLLLKGGSGGHRAGTEHMGPIYRVSPVRADMGVLALCRFPVDLEVTGAQYVLKKWGQGGHDSGQVGMKFSACPEV